MDLPEKVANLCFLFFILREFGGMYTTYFEWMFVYIFYRICQGLFLCLFLYDSVLFSMFPTKY